MRRKILVLLLCFALLFCLTACGVAEPSKSESTAKPDRTYVYDPADFEGLSDERLATDGGIDRSKWYPADDSEAALRATTSYILTRLDSVLYDPSSPERAAVTCTPAIAEEIPLVGHVLGMAMRKIPISIASIVWYLDDVRDTYQFLFGDERPFSMEPSYNIAFADFPGEGIAYETGMTAGGSPPVLVTALTIEEDTVHVTAVRGPEATFFAFEALDDLLARYEADPDAVLAETKDWETVDYTFTIADDGHLVLEL